MPLSAGTVVSGYRIERVLGSGGMGTVYLAAHPVLPRHDALKVLSGEFSRDDAFRARFIREADLAATLDHPNIVTVYNRGDTDDGQLWIAMQYVPGPNADSEVTQRRMTATRAVHVVTEVAKALDYAHQRNVIHRDVKPANFLLTGDHDERVFLADFGIARAVDDSLGLTSTGSMVATIAYGAPEMLGGQPLDQRVDIYSLGCSLYRLLTGETPYAALGTAVAVMAAHLSQPPPRVTDVAPGLPAAIDSVIARAMAKDPAQRYQTATEFATATAAALRGIDTVLERVRPAAAPAAPPATSPIAAVTYPSGHFSEPYRQQPHQAAAVPPGGLPTGRRWWRRPRWIALATSAAVLAAGAGTAGVLRHHSGTQTEIAAPKLMDTGDYAVQPTDTSAVKAGDSGPLFEAIRLGNSVLGPWEIDDALQVFSLTLPGVAFKADYAASLLKDGLPGTTADLLTSHGFVAAFDTSRSNVNATSGLGAVMAAITVLEFPDPESATAAAKDLAAKVDMSDAARALTLDRLPEVTAAAYGSTESGETIHSVSVSAHGAFVIYLAVNAKSAPGSDPDYNVTELQRHALVLQQSRLDGFTPTPVAELPNLLKDPSGGLLGRTLNAPNETTLPNSAGTWRPDGWLQFEAQPVEMAKVLKDAGVDWVTQRLATVYQAKRADLTASLADALVAQMSSAVQPTAEGVPGLAEAKCFERTKDWAKAGDPMTLQQVNWHFKCISSVDRYAFSTFSDTEIDAKRQLTAQYRILTAT